MKIYKYYQGKVHELEVIETTVMYVADKRLCAFESRLRFNKHKVAKTPLEAIVLAITAQESNRTYLKKQIHEIDSDLGQLRRLEKEELKNKNVGE